MERGRERGREAVGGSAARSLPPQEALGKRGELAFPVLNEDALGHEAVELLPLLRHHHPRVLLHAQPQACKKRGGWAGTSALRRFQAKALNAN